MGPLGPLAQVRQHALGLDHVLDHVVVMLGVRGARERGEHVLDRMPHGATQQVMHRLLQSAHGGRGLGEPLSQQARDICAGDDWGELLGRGLTFGCQ
jgi:hypothetical protein